MVKQVNKKSLLLFGVILAGFVLRTGHEYAYLIEYLIMGMLLFPFLSVSFPRDRTAYYHVSGILAAMFSLSALSYGLIMHWDRQIAIVAFLIASTPTATAAPVIVGLLDRDVDYVVASVVITNCVVALVIPFILPRVAYIDGSISSLVILQATSMVVSLPLMASVLIRWTSKRLTRLLSSRQSVPFLIWLIVIYLATARASFYLSESSASHWMVFFIACVALVLCLVNFLIGRGIGGQRYGVEAGQSMGQKNTMLMTWIALECVSPMAALGPIFYLVYQNIYNSILIGKESRVSSR